MSMRTSGVGAPQVEYRWYRLYTKPHDSESTTLHFSTCDEGREKMEEHTAQRDTKEHLKQVRIITLLHSSANHIAQQIFHTDLLG
jgi:hypothetical protein